MWPNV